MNATKETVPALRPVFLPRLHINLPNNLWLAPMAGTTEPVFRSLCRRFGAGLTVTELVSARGIRYQGITPQQYRYLEIGPGEKPILIQLFGFDPEDFKYAVAAIMEHPVLSLCTGVDINMGCPVKKVVKTGAGSALMQSPDKARAIVRAVWNELDGSGKSVSVKFRKGFEADSCTAPGFALQMAETGVDFICLHGRTAAQHYSGLADRTAIQKTVEALRSRGFTTPLIANGDVDSVESGRKMLAQTGANGLMVGRAAKGNPWIFRELAAGLTDCYLAVKTAETASWCDGEFDGGWTTPGSSAEKSGRDTGLLNGAPAPAERCLIILEHLDGLINRLGEPQAVKEMRGQLTAYFKGLPGAVEVRRQGVQAQTRDDVVSLLARWQQDQEN